MRIRSKGAPRVALGMATVLAALAATAPAADAESLAYATYLGGSGQEDFFAGTNLAVDASGGAVVTGNTFSLDFPLLNAADSDGDNNGADTFVTRFDPSGSPLVHSTYLGGPSDMFSNEEGYGVAVDGTGAAVVTGKSCAPDFPTTAGAYQTTLLGGCNPFVAKFDPSGSLVFSTFLGSGVSDGNDVDVDAAGNIYVVGTVFDGTMFPTTPGAFQTTPNGSSARTFVAKLSPDGSTLLYSTLIDGRKDDLGQAISVDDAGSATVAGSTKSGNFPTTAGAFKVKKSGGKGADGFVAKLSPDGSTLLYSTLLGAGGDDNIRDVAVDAAGAAYVVGVTTSAQFPTTPGALQTAAAAADGRPSFVAKFAPGGGSLAYSTFLGALPGAFVAHRAIVVDSAGNASVVGNYFGPDSYPLVDPLPGQVHAPNDIDAVVSTLNPSGSALLFSTYLGGSDYEFGWDIALGAAGAIYVTGITQSGDFPATPGAFQPNRAGPSGILKQPDAFVAKISP